MDPVETMIQQYTRGWSPIRRRIEGTAGDCNLDPANHTNCSFESTASTSTALVISPNRTGTQMDDDYPVNGAGSSQTGCSVKSIHDIISTFDDRKRKLVESIGFGALLKFPKIGSTNRKLSGWLMRRVDSKNSCLTLPCGRILRFYSRDLKLVFGIPDGGKKIVDAAKVSKGKHKMKLQWWPLSGKNQRSIKAVEELVRTTYSHPMTAAQEDAFKVAFVVLVMSTIFVPAAKHDYVHADYWGALSDPSSIHDYDWADYVHNRLILSAARYKFDVETAGRTPFITGCDLFLQIFYLDNLDIPNCSMDHSVQPRIGCYTCDQIRRMIAADTQGRDESTSPFGKSPIRSRDKSCYMWAQSIQHAPENLDRYADQALWDAVVNMVNILKIPLQAAGPLFMAASDFNRRCQMPNPPLGIECIAVLVRIMSPFVNGYNYDFDMHPQSEGWPGLQTSNSNAEWHCKDTPNMDSSSGSAPGAAAAVGTCPESGSISEEAVHRKRSRTSTHDLSHSIVPVLPTDSLDTINYYVLKSMSRFYLLVRYIRERNRLDLNTAAPQLHDLRTTTPIETRDTVGSAKSPWDLGSSWQLYKEHTSLSTSPLNKASPYATASSCTMPWIVDYIPKYIEVMPDAAHDQQIGVSELGMDMFDAIMRCFKHSDDNLCRTEGRHRWRHFFESDILAAVIAGWFDITNPCTRNQFIGTHLGYDLYNCHMLFFPVILHSQWACFAWNLVHNKIIVFDPASHSTPSNWVHTIYTRVADLLKHTLSSVIPALIPGWNYDWTGASLSPFPWHHTSSPRTNRTGVLCAYFCQCFDGHQLLPDLGETNVDAIAKTIFSGLGASNTAYCQIHERSN